MSSSTSSPKGWGNDSLTDYLEAAYRNRYATYANKREWTNRLTAIDACFMRISKDWLNPSNPITPLLFFRCHSTYRAACEHAMAGQVTDTFPQIRACLEYAGYALHIQKNTHLGEVWLKRHDDDASLRSVRNEFSVGRLRQTIKNSNRHAETIFYELYQRAIDFGAHPNERAITGSLRFLNDGDEEVTRLNYLHGDSLSLDHVLKVTAQTGVCALEVLKEAFTARFELLGVTAELLNLRKGL